DLDVVDAMELGLAHGGAGEPGAVDVLALGVAIVHAHRLIVGIVVGGTRIERLADYLHARAAHAAVVDRVAQVDGVEGAARIHVEHGGEADVEIDRPVRKRPQRPRREADGITAGVHVHMTVDHAGHHGGGAQVDHARAFGNLHIGADVGDAVAL